jgi:hypothetical protein
MAVGGASLGLSGCTEKVPATFGYCTVIQGLLVITGGRTVGEVRVVCQRRPEHFSAAAQIQFLHGRHWAMYHMVTSTHAPPAGDVVGAVYRFTTGCLKRTRLRVLLTFRATFGLHRTLKEILYPSTRGIPTRNCDT